MKYENRMPIARGWDGGNGKLPYTGYSVVVLQDSRLSDGEDGRATP